MMDFLAEYGIIGVFIASFLSATILPLASEVVFVGVLAAGANPLWVLISATLGNSLGGITNYLIGILFNPEKALKIMGVKQDKVDKILPFAHKYGSFLAILAFMPIFGDPIMIVLGILRAKIIPVILFSTLGKFLRYSILYAGYYQFI